MIVLDASVLIAHLDRSDTHHQLATSLLADSADEPLSASSITVAEVLVGPARAGHLDRAITVLDQLHIATQHLPEDAALRLALLRAETDLKLPDCCVLLAAEQTGAAVVTFDRRLATAATGRGLAVRDR
ncbi:MAG TPA: PIN domain-containing protein [Acidimicrobiales bacterium]|nr:PIN domain-containing protein [Acidimicrobiales bacterium]